MNDLDLDVLREWPAEDVRPSPEVRAHALVELEQALTNGDVGHAPAARRGRRFAKRLAIAALAAAVLLAGAIVVAQRVVDDRIDRIKTVGIPGDVLGGGELGKVPVNVLVIGSDRRDFVNVDAFGSPTDVPGQRSDTLMLLRIDGGSVRGLWFPRDLLVGPGDGVPINSTFDHGPRGVIDTIRAEFGITVDHFVEVDFAGFQDMVDAVDGVAIYSPGHVRDPYSGLDLTGPGCRTLDGASALAWVRSRHVEIEQNGQWTDASPRADLDRLARQQEFVRALAQRAKQVAGDDPLAAIKLVDAVIPALTVDSQFTRGEILGLVRVVRGLDPAALQLETVPIQVAADGAHAVLAQPAAGEAFAAFRGEPGPEAPPPTGGPTAAPTEC